MATTTNEKDKKDANATSTSSKTTTTTSTKEEDTNKKKKSNSIKETLKQAYAGIKNNMPSIEQETWSNPSYESISDTRVRMPNNSGINVSKAVNNAGQTEYGVDAWGSGEGSGTGWNRQANTPVGRFSATKDGDGVYSLDYTSPISRSTGEYENDITYDANGDGYSDAWLSKYSNPTGSKSYVAGMNTPINANFGELGLNTPLGRVSYGAEDGSVYGRYDSPIRANSEDTFSGIAYNNPMTNGGHYDDFSDAYAMANEDRLMLGAEMPVNMGWLGDRSINTPVGTFGINGGEDSPYGVEGYYQPKENSILARLLARRYGR